MRYSLKLFLFGVLCFVLSQIVIRLPLLNLLRGNVEFSLLSDTYPLLIGFLIALSAGVFEESGRFLFRRYLLRESNSFNDPIVFGLGHGIVEVFMVFVMVISSGHSIFEMGIGLYERLLAVIFHIGMSLIIWNGFLYNKKYLYLVLAIILHGLFNFLIVIMQVFKLDVFLVYGIWTLADIWLIYYIFRSKNFWRVL